MNFWNCNLILAFWHVPCIYPVQKIYPFWHLAANNRWTEKLEQKQVESTIHTCSLDKVNLHMLTSVFDVLLRPPH